MPYPRRRYQRPSKEGALRRHYAHTLKPRLTQCDHPQDLQQGRVGAHPAYSWHMPSGRVGVLFGFFSGPGGRASSEDTCPMGGWADGFLDRAPVGVARFWSFITERQRSHILAQTKRSFIFEHSAPFICLFPACSHRLLQLFVKGPAIGRYNNEHVINYGHDSHLREIYRWRL